jgi:hypothetical protein
VCSEKCEHENFGCGSEECVCDRTATVRPPAGMNVDPACPRLERCLGLAGPSFGCLSGLG